MKTSDKILLYATLTGFALFAGVDLLYFIEYKSGHILSYAQLRESEFFSEDGSAPAHLVLEGPMRAVFYPSDTFHTEIQKEERSHVQFRRSGDTLYIFSDRGDVRNPHGGWFEFSGLPIVNIFSKDLNVDMHRAFGVVNNPGANRNPGYSFNLDNAQVWFGGYNFEKDTSFPVQHWDSVAIRASNSTVVFNRQSRIHDLQCVLDDNSTVNDRYSTIDTGVVRGEINSSVVLQGRNFKTVRLEISPAITP